MKFIFSKEKVFPFSCVSMILLSHLAFADDQTSTTSQATPVGYWQTIDDVTNLPRSIVKICQLNDKHLYGRIVQVNYRQNEGPQDTCTLCSTKDPRHNQPNLGMVILTGLQATSDPLIWNDGNVLDPVDGKVYDAKISLASDGKSLSLRGYIGFSLLGRSQTWTQVTPAQFENLIGKPLKKNLGGYYQTTQGKYVAANYDSCGAVQTEVNQMNGASANSTSADSAA